MIRDGQIRGKERLHLLPIHTDEAIHSEDAGEEAPQPDGQAVVVSGFVQHEGEQYQVFATGWMIRMPASGEAPSGSGGPAIH